MNLDEKYDLKNIALACEGVYVGTSENENQEFSSVFIDSRKVEKGGLFVPFNGNKVDAHDFIEEVMLQGALCTLTEKELGLPLTIFRLKEFHEIAVLEMGIRNFGDLHRLADIARPDICVITNINACHLEYLKSLDGVLKAKSEIFDFISPKAHIVLNGDDEKLASINEIKGIQPVFLGVNNTKDIWANGITPHNLDGISCKIHVENESFSSFIATPGHHIIYNALAGTAVGLACALTLDEIKQGIERFQTINGRFVYTQAL